MRSSRFFLVPALSLVACGPSPAEIDAAVDARLRAKGLIKSEEEEKAAEAAEATKSEWQKSLDFLAALDKLMADYKPVAVVDTEDPFACITKARFADSPELTTAARAVEAKKAASLRAAQSEARSFERLKWLQYRIDYGWANRLLESAPVYGCWGGSWGWVDVNPTRCAYLDNTWQVRFPSAPLDPPTSLYTRKPLSEPGASAPPELMKRIESAKLTIPERFSCRVHDVLPARDNAHMIACDDGMGAAGPYIQAGWTDAEGSAAGMLVGGLRKGDVVSFPLRDMARDPSGVLYKEVWNGDAVWIVSASAAAMRPDAPAECPSYDAMIQQADRIVNPPAPTP